MSRRNPYALPSAAQLAREDNARKREQAAQLTKEFAAAREVLRTLLKRAHTVGNPANWIEPDQKSKFKPKKFEVPKPLEPAYLPLPAPVEVGVVAKLFGQAKRIADDHQRRVQEVEVENARLRSQYAKKVEAWEQEKADFEARQQVIGSAAARQLEKDNDELARKREAWRQGDPTTVLQYVEAATRSLEHPAPLAPRIDLQYDAAKKLLLIDYRLPNPDELPLTKTVKFNATTQQVSTSQISQKEARELYDDLCYQVCLRTLRTVFNGDTHGHIEAIAFNGYVHAKNEATGHSADAVILSIVVDKASLKAVKLDQVDPKACFKALKGVSASSLAGLAPVVPVLQFDKVDKRFIAAEEVELADDGSVNLASMGWEDFEHLVRQLFEKEFASRGGEVKVTQSSADGGVDAVAFDPDPITGGKIVIQAKRYTRPVGSALSATSMEQRSLRARRKVSS